MKKTEQDRRDRELKRQQKKANKMENILDKEDLTPGVLMTQLFELFQYDEEEIYNIQHNEKILETIIDMKETIPENKLDQILRKTIKRTKIKNKTKAFDELKKIFDEL